MSNNNNSSGVAQTSHGSSASAADGEVIHDQITTINDDIPVVTKTRPMPQEHNTPLCLSLCEPRIHTILDFMSRPTLVATFGWSTISNANTSLITPMSFPATFLNNVMIADKVKGFLGFKGRLILSLQINAERFQQGRLIMSWFPQTQYATLSRINASYNSLCSVTQLPHVEFDLNTNSTVQLAIPYVSPTVAYDLYDGEGQAGAVSVIVYSPLATGTGSTTVTCKIWAHYEEPELSFPVRPQSGGVTSRGKKKRNLIVDPSELEALATGVGPISNLLAGTARFATVLSSVLILSSFMTPVSWATGIMARTAASFGFSKPQLSNPQARVVSSKFPYNMNSEGFDSAQNLGMFADSKVAMMPSFGGTDIDEMDLNYIAQVPSFFINFSWSSSFSTDQELMNVTLNPLAFVTTQASGGTTVFRPSPMCFIANVFSLWRGSFVFTFKFVKTEFHSGRLIFAFEPIDPTVNFPVTTTNCNYLYKEIIDIRTSNEFTVTVPYVSVHPYMFTNGSAAAISSGRVYLIIETPLKAPTNCATSIDVLVEVAAGPDFEFAVPRAPALVPVTYSGGTLPNIVDPGPKKKVAAVDLPVVAQALGEEILPVSTNIAPIDIINNDANSGGLAPSMLCIGERIKSVRQLIKRSNLYYAADGFAATSSFEFTPRLISTNSVGTLGGVSAPPVIIDYINYFGMCYRYHRGGASIRFYSEDPDTDISYSATLVTTATTIGFPAGVSPNTTATQGGVAFGSSSAGGGVEVSIPHYQRWPFNTIYEQTLLSSTAALTFSDSMTVRLKTNVATDRPRIFRQAADDFAFGYFIGVPLLVLRSVASGTVPWS